MKTRYLPVLMLLALPFLSFSQACTDPGEQRTPVNLELLDGSTDPITDINNAGLLIDGEIITVYQSFNGAGTADEFLIDDDQLTGCVGPHLGVANSATTADNMEFTVAFGGPITEFCFRLVDIDRNDQAIVEGFSNGMAYTLTAADFTFPYTGGDGPCPTYLGSNTFQSTCNPPAANLNNTLRGVVDICFPGELDSMKITYSDYGSTAGGSFTICSFTACEDVLPIELSQFNAQEEACKGILEWTTETESNFDFFEIQKSIDGKQFHEVGTIKGKGENGLGANYTWTDNNLNAQNYYRLKSTDLDNTFQLSEVVQIQAKCADLVAISNIFPNPIIGGQANVEIFTPLEAQHAEIKIYSMTSRLMESLETHIKTGKNVIEIDIAGLSAGIYQIVIEGDSWKSQGKRFVKIN